MICPACANGETQVTDSRPWNGMIKRRRRCPVCGFRMGTVEVPRELIDELPELLQGLLDANAKTASLLTALDNVHGDIAKRMRPLDVIRTVTYDGSKKNGLESDAPGPAREPGRRTEEA